jgi:hypothetical protein
VDELADLTLQRRTLLRQLMMNNNISNRTMDEKMVT